MFLKQPSIILIVRLLCSVYTRLGESMSMLALNLTPSERKGNGKLVPPSCSPSRISSPVTLESLVLSARRTGPAEPLPTGKKIHIHILQVFSSRRQKRQRLNWLDPFCRRACVCCGLSRERLLDGLPQPLALLVWCSTLRSYLSRRNPERCFAG